MHLKALVQLVVVLCRLVWVTSADGVEVFYLHSARVGEYVVFFDDEILSDWVLVVNHNDFAPHQLKAGIADCTRVI